MAFKFEELKGKTCIITGGGGVIGKALASALASVKCRVIILDLVKEAADRVAKEITAEYKVNCEGIAANVLDRLSLVKAKEEEVTEV